MIYSKNKINFLILISFILSTLLSTYYINKYDKYSEYQNNKHPMIKVAVQNHWNEAQAIIEDIKKGKNFFESGPEHTDSFLPQKILALFYLLIDQDLEENEVTKTDNGKLYYLILKSFFYYFVIFLLTKELSKFFSNKQTFYTVFFLALIPDIFQYHSSFWTESLFFSFQLLLIYFFFKNSEKKILNNVAIGIVAGLLYSISVEYFVYIIFLIIVYIIIYKSKSFKPVLNLLIGYSFILLLIFASNSLKNKSDKIVAYGIKSAFYIYLVPNIISENENISVEESFQYLKNEDKKWANEKNISYTDESYILLKIENYDENEKYLNYIFKKSVILIIKNPLVTLKSTLPKYFHTITLNPFYINYFYKYDGKEQFLKTDTHKNLIPIRIFYSLLVYLIILIGFIKTLKQKKNHLNIFLIISIFYVILSLGWFGNPRYFTPALIFMSIYVGNFFSKKSDYIDEIR